MNKLLIQGRHSTFENSKGEKNIPIERKRDIREDASWYSTIDSAKVLPILTHEQYEDIRYEHDSITHIPITHNDIIRKQHGEHTDPIVNAYLNAEYQYKITNEIRKKHKGMGWIESPLRSLDVYSDFNQKRTMLTSRKPFKDCSNEELLKIMFTYFRLFASEYVGDLEDNFRSDGKEKTLEFTLESWPVRGSTNLNKLLASLKDKIKIAYQNNAIQDISAEIGANLINFSNAWFMMPQRMAFGGIQEVELKGFLSNEKQKKGRTVLTVKLEFVMKDWFGVDEEDVYKNANSTQLCRDSLAAFWVLQHQRGYRPFINEIYYTETKEYVF